MALALALLAPSFPLPAWAAAQEEAFSAAFSRCMDASGGVTVAMRDCYAAETERQDQRLNVVYSQLRRQLAPSARAKLLQAQRAWLAYRKAECAYAMTPDEGGTLALVTGDDCWLRATAERVSRLEQHRGVLEAR